MLEQGEFESRAPCFRRLADFLRVLRSLKCLKKETFPPSGPSTLTTLLNPHLKIPSTFFCGKTPVPSTPMWRNLPAPCLLRGYPQSSCPHFPHPFFSLKSSLFSIFYQHFTQKNPRDSPSYSPLYQSYPHFGDNLWITPWILCVILWTRFRKPLYYQRFSVCITKNMLSTSYPHPCG